MWKIEKIYSNQIKFTRDVQVLIKIYVKRDKSTTNGQRNETYEYVCLLLISIQIYASDVSSAI